MTEKVSFEWSYHRISCTDSKPGNIHNKYMYYHVKELMKRSHLNRYTIGFHPNSKATILTKVLGTVRA